MRLPAPNRNNKLHNHHHLESAIILLANESVLKLFCEQGGVNATVITGCVWLTFANIRCWVNLCPGM